MYSASAVWDCCNNNNNKNPSSQHHVTLNGKVQLNRIARDDKRRLLLTGGDLGIQMGIYIHIYRRSYNHTRTGIIIIVIVIKRRSRIIFQQIMCVYLALDTRDHSRTPTNQPGDNDR